MKVITDEEYMQFLAYKKCALEGHDLDKSTDYVHCRRCEYGYVIDR